MRTAPSLMAALSIVLFAPAAFADEDAPPPLPPPTAAAPAPATAPAAPTTTVQAAPGTGGLTVVAPLAGGGTVTAVGCSSVVVGNHSTEVRPGDPCPAPQVHQAPPPPPAPRYAPDGGRKAAVITAPIVYGLGAMISGVSYLTNKASCDSGHFESTVTGYRRTYDNDCSDASAALIAYGAISAGVPSIPRWVVGDAGRAVAYTAARGASIAAAAFIDWGDSDDSWMGPFLFGFAAPVTLAVVDMATTPHREDLEDPKDREPREAKKPEAARVTHIAPVAVADREGRSPGAAVTLGGTF